MISWLTAVAHAKGSFAHVEQTIGGYSAERVGRPAGCAATTLAGTRRGVRRDRRSCPDGCRGSDAAGQ